MQHLIEGFPTDIQASLVAQLVKNPPAMWETWVQSLGWEDPLEKGMAYSLQQSGLENSIDCRVHGVRKSRTQLRDFHFHAPSGNLGSIPGLARSPGEGNGYPPQYSYPENPMDRGA